MYTFQVIWGLTSKSFHSNVFCHSCWGLDEENLIAAFVKSCFMLVFLLSLIYWQNQSRVCILASDTVRIVRIRSALEVVAHSTAVVRYKAMVLWLLVCASHPEFWLLFATYFVKCSAWSSPVNYQGKVFEFLSSRAKIHSKLWWPKSALSSISKCYSNFAWFNFFSTNSF